MGRRPPGQIQECSLRAERRDVPRFFLGGVLLKQLGELLGHRAAEFLASTMVTARR